MTTALPPLILASSSPYRRQLLERLGLPYQAIAADIDESRLPLESPDTLALRLASQKASKIAADHPQAIVIGSDQVCIHGNDTLGKPASVENACQQLLRFSGQRIEFVTSLAVINGPTGTQHTALERYAVIFRELTEREVEHYINKERPLDSAGAFYMEGLGISLFERMEGDDPTTLMGLPLIRLCALLRTAGVDPLAA